MKNCIGPLVQPELENQASCFTPAAIAGHDFHYFPCSSLETRFEDVSTHSSGLLSQAAHLLFVPTTTPNIPAARGLCQGERRAGERIALFANADGFEGWAAHGIRLTRTGGHWRSGGGGATVFSPPQQNSWVEFDRATRSGASETPIPPHFVFAGNALFWRSV